MSRLTEKIDCVECGAERMITKACINLVKRCKVCQKVFNRDKARNRYREIKGISADDPIRNIIKKKEPTKKPEKPEKPKGKIEVQKEQFPAPVVIAPVAQDNNEGEKKIRLAAINKLMGLLEDDGEGYNDDDW